MLQTKTCINISSDMNTWINFCVVFNVPDITKAEEIVQKAYNDWWELPDIQFEPIADYISRCLMENDIEHEFVIVRDIHTGEIKKTYEGWASRMPDGSVWIWKA